VDRAGNPITTASVVGSSGGVALTNCSGDQSADCVPTTGFFDDDNGTLLEFPSKGQGGPKTLDDGGVRVLRSLNRITLTILPPDNATISPKSRSKVRITRLSENALSKAPNPAVHLTLIAKMNGIVDARRCLREIAWAFMMCALALEPTTPRIR
jgi:hypothetical protein